MSIKPITPNEVKASVQIPDFVIGVFNELIKKHWNGSQARFNQADVTRAIMARWIQLHETELKTDKIYSKGWLDVEDLFRKAGWNVDYDKPGYCETYEPFFTFRKK